MINNYSLALGLALSLLIHILVLLFFGIFLTFHPVAPAERTMKNLEVRLTPPSPAKVQAKPGNDLLATRSAAPFKIARAKEKEPPDNKPDTVAKIVAPAPPATDEVKGVDFPGTTITPRSDQTQTNHPLFQARVPRQDTARISQQQALEAQTRQQNEQQTQILILQLQQLLGKILEGQQGVSGKCVLNEPAGGVNHIFKCNSSALYETLYNNEMMVADMLLALRGKGQMFNGFSAETSSGKLSIKLIEENSGARQ